MKKILGLTFGMIFIFWPSVNAATSPIYDNPVAEPAIMLLFGIGLVGISVIGRKRYRAYMVESGISLSSALKHYLNPLHVYCRIRDLGLRKRPAAFLCRMYERAVFNRYILVKE